MPCHTPKKKHSQAQALNVSAMMISFHHRSGMQMGSKFLWNVNSNYMKRERKQNGFSFILFGYVLIFIRSYTLAYIMSWAPNNMCTLCILNDEILEYIKYGECAYATVIEKKRKKSVQNLTYSHKERCWFHLSKPNNRWSNKIVWTMLFNMLYGILQNVQVFCEFSLSLSFFILFIPIILLLAVCFNHTKWRYIVRFSCKSLETDRLNALRTNMMTFHTQYRFCCVFFIDRNAFGIYSQRFFLLFVQSDWRNTNNHSWRKEMESKNIVCWLYSFRL